MVKIAKIVAHRVSRWGEQIVINGFDEFGMKPKGRRALLSYLVLPLLPPPQMRDRVKFSNRGIAQELVRGLNELGYIVDIVNFDNQKWEPTKNYDLFVGHGGLNFRQLATAIPGTAKRIYFSTGLYWREQNIRIARRLYGLALRRGFLLPSYRSPVNDEEYANQISDGIICLGNHNSVASYSQFPKVFGINNAIFPLDWQGWKDKNYEAGKKHFLFFSGRGNLLKGLDLLLEAFVETDLHLHICQHMEPDFARVYDYELTKCSNIHVHHFINMRSQEFNKLAMQCNWIISASSTEGQPGAVLECMRHGLLPILPDSANIDLGSWGIRLENCEVQTIRACILDASQWQTERCQQSASAVVDLTRETYSPEHFRESFKEAVTKIL